MEGIKRILAGEGELFELYLCSRGRGAGAVVTGAWRACTHYYKKTLIVVFKKTLRGGDNFKLPLLMPTINQSDHFSLTEAVTKTV